MRFTAMISLTCGALFCASFSAADAALLATAPLRNGGYGTAAMERGPW